MLPLQPMPLVSNAVSLVVPLAAKSISAIIAPTEHSIPIPVNASSLAHSSDAHPAPTQQSAANVTPVLLFSTAVA